LPLGLHSPDFPKSKITVELDTAHAAWVSHDVALLSTKTGNLLLLSLVYDGRCGGNPSYPVLFVTYVHCFCDQKQDENEILGLHNPVVLCCLVMGLYVEGLDGDSAKRIEDLGFLSLLLLQQILSFNIFLTIIESMNGDAVGDAGLCRI
jgi:hypothetical protein